MFKKKSNAEEEQQWDPVFEPLMKALVSKRGIKTKSASEVAKKKVDYFRGRDFKKWLLDAKSEELLKKKCAEALKVACEGKPPTTDKDVEALGAELIQRGFCYKAMYKPINPQSKQEDGSEKKPKKWPDRLMRTPNQSFDSESFYVITYEGGKGLQHFLLVLIILGILLACMFPVWPMWAKIGIWYLSVIFLFLYFGLLIVRMVIFALFWIVGFDFWIFPNINDEYCGFLDSFKPLYSWEKRKDDALMLVVRFGSLAIVAVAVQQIAETHSLSDVRDFMEAGFTDVLDWGVDKLTAALPGGEKAALPSVDELKAQEAEELAKTVPITTDAGEDDDDDATPAADSTKTEEAD